MPPLEDALSLPVRTLRVFPRSSAAQVFIQLVESSCKPDTPQCFLLTPKLLPGLPFERAITVLSIMNGPGIDRAVIDAYGAHKVPQAPRGGGGGGGAAAHGGVQGGDLMTCMLGARWAASNAARRPVAAQ